MTITKTKCPNGLYMIKVAEDDGRILEMSTFNDDADASCVMGTLLQVLTKAGYKGRILFNDETNKPAMKFRIKTSVNHLRRENRRKLDADITAILGTNADDAKYDGIIVWRKFGDAEIVDTPNTKTISGKADPEKVTALLKVLSNYGCELA